MWSAIFQCITKGFNSIYWMFSGLEYFMKSFSQLGQTTYEQTLLMSEEANIKRQASRAALLKEHNVTAVTLIEENTVPQS